MAREAGGSRTGHWGQGKGGKDEALSFKDWGAAGWLRSAAHELAYGPSCSFWPLWLESMWVVPHPHPIGSLLMRALSTWGLEQAGVRKGGRQLRRWWVQPGPRKVNELETQWPGFSLILCEGGG